MKQMKTGLIVLLGLFLTSTTSAVSEDCLDKVFEYAHSLYEVESGEKLQPSAKLEKRPLSKTVTSDEGETYDVTIQEEDDIMIYPLADYQVTVSKNEECQLLEVVRK